MPEFPIGSVDIGDGYFFGTFRPMLPQTGLMPAICAGYQLPHESFPLLSGGHVIRRICHFLACLPTVRYGEYVTGSTWLDVLLDSGVLSIRLKENGCHRHTGMRSQHFFFFKSTPWPTCPFPRGIFSSVLRPIFLTLATPIRPNRVVCMACISGVEHWVCITAGRHLKKS